MRPRSSTSSTRSAPASRSRPRSVPRGQRRRPDGGAATERGRRRAGKGLEAFELKAFEEAAEGCERPGGNADDDRRQKNDQGSGPREKDLQAAAQLSLAIRGPGRV